MTNQCVLLQVTSKPSKAQEPEFGINSVVSIGIAGKELYGRGSVVRQGSKLASKYNLAKLKYFVELTSLMVVGDKSTIQTSTTTNYCLLSLCTTFRHCGPSRGLCLCGTRARALNQHAPALCTGS